MYIYFKRVVGAGSDNYIDLQSKHLHYEINKIFCISSYPTLENCLFGAVSLTKNGYGIGFDMDFFQTLVVEIQ